MNLDTVRTGDILLFRKSKTWFGRIIRWWTQSPYSHAAVVLEINLPGVGTRKAVIESLEPYGVRVFPLERYLADQKVSGGIIDWYIADESLNRQKLADYCLGTWGDPYSQINQLLWSFLPFGKWVRKVYPLPANINPSRYFCSELVAGALEAAGYQGGPDPVLVTPGDVSHLPCLIYMGSLEA